MKRLAGCCTELFAGLTSKLWMLPGLGLRDANARAIRVRDHTSQQRHTDGIKLLRLRGQTYLTSSQMNRQKPQQPQTTGCFHQ